MQYIPYIIMSILAILLGQVAKHLCKKLPKVVAEEIKYKEFFSTLFTDYKFDIKYSVIFLILFNLLVFYVGSTYISYIYAFCIFSLAIAFSVDFRFQLLPDECHILIAILGLINIIFNFNNVFSYLLGGLAGGAIFYILGLLSIVIFKKEGMGFGDVKLMAALGLLFGLKNILVIALVSFFIGAITAIILMIFRSKKAMSYMAFGPFIVIAAILIMFIPADTFINMYIGLCTAISDRNT